MTVIAAVDNDEGSRNVVHEGYDLAQSFDEELIVLHVLPETEKKETAQATAQEFVDEELPTVENVSARGQLGDPEVRILQSVRDTDAHYVVLGSRKQTPAGKALFGSVAQIVILNTNHTVVIASSN